jgi:ketosteroid isomerase-like protein
MSAETIITKLYAALNDHDLDSFIDCFAEDYNSKQPVYPDRSFQVQA